MMCCTACMINLFIVYLLNKQFDCVLRTGPYNLSIYKYNHFVIILLNSWKSVPSGCTPAHVYLDHPRNKEIFQTPQTFFFHLADVFVFCRYWHYVIIIILRDKHQTIHTHTYSMGTHSVFDFD